MNDITDISADNTVIVCIGSNTPDRQGNIRRALEAFNSVGHVTAESSIYENPADNGSDAAYLNAVACIRTDMNEAELSRFIASLEKEAGRTPQSKPSGIMPLDIDVVIVNGAVRRPYDYSRPYFTTGYAQIAKRTH